MNKIDPNTYKTSLGVTVIIGAGDIGEAIAEYSAIRDASAIVLTGRTRMEKVNLLAEKIRAFGVPSAAHQLTSLLDLEQLGNLFKRTEQEFGKPQTIIIGVANQEGEDPEKFTLEQRIEIGKRMFETNVIGIGACAELFATQMNEGSIVIVGSDQALREEADPTTGLYDSSKSGIGSYALRLAHRFPNVQINVVHPGWVQGTVGAEGFDDIDQHILLGRKAHARDVAIGVVHMALETHVTGTERVIANGGGTSRAHLRQ